jgi:hypothetical protein
LEFPVAGGDGLIMVAPEGVVGHAQSFVLRAELGELLFGTQQFAQAGREMVRRHK